MEQGPQNAIANLQQAARAILNWEKVGKLKLAPSRRVQLKELAEVTPQKLEQNSAD